MIRNPVQLWLPGYVTPSLNDLLGKHYFVLEKEKARARQALLCALVDWARQHSTSITPPEVANSLLINSAIAALSRETIRKKSKSSSARRAPSTKMKPAPGSKSGSIPRVPPWITRLRARQMLQEPEQAPW